MKVRNMGPWDMDVPLGTYESVTVKQGETADLPQMLADELVARGEWEAVNDTPPKADKAATKKGGES